MMERKIAFFVSSWASIPSIFSWVWLKQNFLRKTTPDASNPDGFVLSEADILYVVHINKGSDDDEGWSMGGPVQPDLRYPHKTVVLDAGGASLQSVMVDWIDRNSPDILVFGIREKGKPHKVVEYLRQHSTVPFLVVQPENVRNDRLRLTSDANERHRVQGTDASSSKQLATSPPSLATVAEEEDASGDEEEEELLFAVDGTTTPAASLRLPDGHTRPRKIAIAYEHDATGAVLLSFAARVVLQPHDSVLLVHCMVGNKRDQSAVQSSSNSHGILAAHPPAPQDGNALAIASHQSSGKSNGVEGGGDSFSRVDTASPFSSNKSMHAGLDLATRESSGCMPRSGGVAGALERIATRRRGRGDDTINPSSSLTTSSPTHEPAFADELLQGFNVVHSVRLRGDPRHMLCRFAAQMGIDMLIMGSSGRSMLKRALTGIQSAKALKMFTAISPAHSSVSRHVISHAPCPVLLVPFGKAGNSPTSGGGGVSTPVAGEDDQGIPLQRPHSIGGSPPGMSPPTTSPRWQPTNGGAPQQLLSRDELLQLVIRQERQLQEKEHQIAALRAQLMKGGIGAA